VNNNLLLSSNCWHLHVS